MLDKIEGSSVSKIVKIFLILCTVCFFCLIGLIMFIVALNTYVSKKCENVIDTKYSEKLIQLEDRIEELELKNMMTANIPEPILIKDTQKVPNLNVEVKLNEQKSKGLQKP